MNYTLSLLLAGLALTVPLTAQAQDGRAEAVIEVVDRFLYALNTHDADLMASTMTETGTVSLIDVNEDGNTFRARDFAGMVEGLRGEDAQFRETYWDANVLVNGPVAVVMAPYSFDFGDQRSHCGVDVFTLFAIGDEWRIASIQYSVDANGCPAGR